MSAQWEYDNECPDDWPELPVFDGAMSCYVCAVEFRHVSGLEEYTTARCNGCKADGGHSGFYPANDENGIWRKQEEADDD
jgi:hypothetical protein